MSTSATALLTRVRTWALFSTHPPVEERVRRLRAYDRERAPAGLTARTPATGLS
jgi:Zn-dependent protease with chaperone function